MIPGRLSQDISLFSRDMDQTTVLIGVASFGAGFWLRSNLIDNTPNCPACNCVCKCAAAGTSSDSLFSSLTAWVLACFLILLSVLILSNAALVFKVTVRDNGSGSKEYQFGVKGKSKGVPGAHKGLAITG